MLHSPVTQLTALCNEDVHHERAGLNRLLSLMCSCCRLLICADQETVVIYLNLSHSVHDALLAVLMIQ